MKPKKPPSPEEQLVKLVDELRKSYDQWQHYHDHGGSDPNWPDGSNMKLICNHILWDKRQIKELCEESGLPLPEEYHRPPPPEVPLNYMARPMEIYDHARASLARYEADTDYQYILANIGKADKKTEKNLHVKAVLGYVDYLRSAIARNDLVAMRIHEHSDRYIDSFRSCAGKLNAALAEANAPCLHLIGEQFSLF